MSADQFSEINDELQELLAERLPMTFPPKFSWDFWATALLARLAAILDGMDALVSRGRRAEAEVALRSLYEQVTLLCWLGIDPTAHLRQWEEDSQARWRVFHNEAKNLFGQQVLDPKDAAELATSRTGPSLQQRAAAIDEYWPAHIAAFRQHPEDGKELLTFEGCYTSIYRTSSRVAHAEVDSLQPFVNVKTSWITVSTKEREKFGRAVFAFPLAGYALLVYHRHFGWPADGRVDAISESLLNEGE